MDKIKELLLYMLVILGMLYIGAYVQLHGVVINDRNLGGIINNNSCTGGIITNNQ